MVAVVLGMRDAGVEMPVLTGQFGVNVLFVRTCKELNWTPKTIYVAAHAALPEWYDTLQADVGYTTSEGHFHHEAKYPFIDEFVQHFQEMYGVVPAYQGAVSFAACQVIQEAIEGVGYLEEPPQDETMDYIRDHEFMTVCGPQIFDERGVPEFHALLIQWQKTEAGEWRRFIVWPHDAATGEMVYPMPTWEER